ncbi:nitroreductase [Chloroflexota bacterium]
MDVIEAIRSRKSIRGYKPDPVPKEVLREILDIATHSPSAINTQPWEITVVTGEVLQKMSQANTEMSASGASPKWDFPRQPLEGKHKQRQIEIAIMLWELMGITREDKDKRSWWDRRGDQYFDAPAAIILSMDKTVGGVRGLLDIGALMQTICVTAWSYDLGTCIIGRGVWYPEVVRKFTNIPESAQIIIAITIGYPDWDFPANKIESPREPIDNTVSWFGFD